MIDNNFVGSFWVFNSEGIGIICPKARIFFSSTSVYEGWLCPFGKGTFIYGFFPIVKLSDFVFYLSSRSLLWILKMYQFIAGHCPI